MPGAICHGSFREVALLVRSMRTHLDAHWPSCEFDTIIRGGVIIEGTRLPRFRDDIGLKDGRVAKIGRLKAHEGAHVIDADGLIVAPGFIDLHTHYDAQLFWDPYCSISGWHG
jgi:N-acyl-D-aspartate/D-glutamate deacylase